jgi:hypothetical protein
VIGRLVLFGATGGGCRTTSRDSPLAVIAARMVTIDIMVFAGVDLQQAMDAVREGTGEFHVPSPVQPARVPCAGEHDLRTIISAAGR